MSLFNTKKTEEKGKKTAKGEAVAKKASKPASMKELYGEETKAKAAEAAVVAVDGKKEVAATKNSSAFRVLVKPLVTEKGSILGAESKYTFMVANEANKIEIAKAIEDTYGVKPTKVNVINIEGKTKNRGRIAGKRKDWKKAIVTLPKGKTIKIFEGI
jgi:large subunit ribosomal protein L23